MNETVLNLKDLEEKVLKKNKYLTDFITPIEVNKIIEYFKNRKEVSHTIYQVCDISLERTKIYLCKTELLYDVIDYANVEESYNIQILKIIPNKFSKKLYHKDYLGTILGLGIKREKIGDIILTNDNSAYVFVSLDICDYIEKDLKKIGHETVRIIKVQEINKNDLKIDYKERDITLSSYRLDNFIAHGFGISRRISSELIEKELVKVNYEDYSNPLYEIKEEDLISVRGYGRLKVIKLDGENKKGRKRVNVHVFKKEK